MNRIEAYLDKMDFVTILLSKEGSPANNGPFFLREKNMNKRIKLATIKMEELKTDIKYSCQLPTQLDLSKKYVLLTENGDQTELLIGSVMRTNEFDLAFYYEGDDLGALYDKEETAFKVWAPTASNVTLKLYNTKGFAQQHIEMIRGEKGVWFTIQAGDLEGYYYRYNVCVNNSWREAVDPYVKATSANGEYGVVIDLEKTKVTHQSSFLPPCPSLTDAIIYETHIRDFSIHPKSGVKHKGKYKAFCEEGTRGPNNSKTCLDYIVDLGITHLELLPFNDFGGVDETSQEDQYNWGYNPVHYNVPEGSYATNPYDPYVRIIETKEMIEALHRKGIRVMMDVVYNHVYIRELSSFRKIVPGYFFRYNEMGLPSNGTGVGNDIASERLMVRKFILDSIQYWIKEYNVDGFRFDLMGILDIDTMNAIRVMIDKINPTILLIGEGWNLNTPIPDTQKATIMNADKMPRIAHFNDIFRDTVKGSIFNLQEKGFISGNDKKKEPLRELLAGSITLTVGTKGMFESPTQTVNYVECHDNHTLWDKLQLTNPEESEEIRKRRESLAIAMVLFSQGIPFLHSGIEFFRTKYGEGNSYNLPDDINQLDWIRKSMYEDHISFVRTLISIRKSHPAFRFTTLEQIKKHYNWLSTPPGLAGYMLDHLQGIDTWSKIMVFFNNSLTIQLYSLLNDEDWYVAVDGDQASEQGLRTIKNKIIIKPLSTAVLFTII